MITLTATEAQAEANFYDIESKSDELISGLLKKKLWANSGSGSFPSA